MTLRLAIGLAVLVVLGFILLTVPFVVTQTEQAIVVQFGAPIRVVLSPGLQFKPPWQSLIFYDRRVLDFVRGRPHSRTFQDLLPTRHPEKEGVTLSHPILHFLLSLFIEFESLLLLLLSTRLTLGKEKIICREERDEEKINKKKR